MSEDYKKIALEDVKVGQRVRIVERYTSHTATYEGVVFRTSTEWSEVDMGTEEDVTTVFIGTIADTYILLLEDAPKPKVVSVETVTITRYDDGTEKTETVSEGIPVPMSDDGGTEWVPTPTAVHTMGKFEEFEDYFKTVVLKDAHGDYWTHQDGQWRWTFGSMLPDITWHTPTLRGTFEDSLPMTVVENVGD